MKNSETNKQERRLLELEQRVTQQVNRLESLLDRMENMSMPMGKFSEQGCKSNVYFFEFMHTVIIRLRDEGRDRTAEAYQSAFTSFRKFLRYNDIYLCDIDEDLIKDYEVFLHHGGLSKNSSSFYMRILRAVLNRAIDRNLVSESNPFRHVYTGVDKTVKRAINLSAIKRIKNLNLAHDKPCDFARDMFMFSFYMRGMSFIDMAHLRRSNLSRGYVTYRRRKTGQELCIKWEKCMQQIVDKYRVKCCGDYMLPILKGNSKDRNQYKYMLSRLNKSLRDVAIYARIFNLPLTLYVARHSWASIAKSKKIPLSVISESMGHDSEKTTRIYLTTLDRSVVDNANTKILSELL
jgi:integrase